MDGQPLAVSCTPTEAAFLAGLLGASALVGMADPFTGWLAAEIETAWATARKELAQKHFIEVQPDGTIVMDIGVATLMETWAQADASLLLTATGAGGMEENSNFHLRGRLAVEQRITNDGIIWLTPLEDTAAVYGEVIRRLRLREQPAAPGLQATLSEAVFIRARTAAAGQGAAAADEVLRQARLPAATAAALAAALAAPVVNGAVAALARRTTGWEVAGMGVLEGPAGLWRLRAFTREGQNWVEIVPCSGQDARQELRRVLNRVLREPLTVVTEV
jgi:hypothetical protein